MLQGSSIDLESQGNQFQARGVLLVGGGGLGVEPALEPRSHRLDLQGLGLACQPGAPLQAQEVLAIDLVPQQDFKRLPIDRTLEP